MVRFANCDDICDVRDDDGGEVEGFGDDGREFRGKNEEKLVVEDLIGDFGDFGENVGDFGDFGDTGKFDENFGDFGDNGVEGRDG